MTLRLRRQAQSSSQCLELDLGFLGARSSLISISYLTRAARLSELRRANQGDAPHLTGQHLEWMRICNSAAHFSPIPTVLLMPDALFPLRKPLTHHYLLLLLRSACVNKPTDIFGRLQTYIHTSVRHGFSSLKSLMAGATLLTWASGAHCDRLLI